MAVQKTNTQNLSSLIINKVDSKDTFQSMVTNNLINANELYLVQSELGEDSEIFPIEFEIEEHNGSSLTATCDKTLTEIFQAIEDGYLISARGVVSDTGVEIYIDLNYYAIDPESILFTSSVLSEGNGFTPQIIHIIYSQTGIFAENIPLTSSNQTLTIGSYTYDGSSAVNIPVYDGTYTWG